MSLTRMHINLGECAQNLAVRVGSLHEESYAWQNLGTVIQVLLPMAPAGPVDLSRRQSQPSHVAEILL